MKAFCATLLCTLLCGPAAIAQQTVGLFVEDTASEPGYVLFGPLAGKTTYLIDKCGKQINSWTSAYDAGAACYLLPDGSLLRGGSYGNTTFNHGGNGGIIERQSWSGTMLWSYVLSTTDECQHHEVCPLPNGNVLALVWEKHTASDAVANGRDTATLGATLWSEKIMELQPTGANGARVVWEWHAWDHLVQNRNPRGPSYGMPADHPELINFNYLGTHAPARNVDWLHINSLAYNAQFDQIVMSSFYMDEIWIIDHNTTTREAASHSGGARGHGGDLLYRWGNPAAYGLGTPTDHLLFSPHNPQWIPQGFPGAGNITIYNNGTGRPEGSYSTVDEITPAADTSGNYIIGPAQPYGPPTWTWRYQAPNPPDFYSANISGAQRLQSGHTLIDEGLKGNFFEVDSSGDILWRYVNPANATGVTTQGNTPGVNFVFRAVQYSPGYAAFTGRTLTPGAPVEISPISYNCYFKADTSTPTGIRSGMTIPVAEVVNPLGGTELRIRAGSDLPGARLVLLNALGQRCTVWNADLRGHVWITLPLPDDITPGHYTLHIAGPDGLRSSMALMRL